MSPIASSVVVDATSPTHVYAHISPPSVREQRRIEHHDFVLEKKITTLKRKKDKAEQNASSVESKDVVWNSYAKWDIWDAEKCAENQREEIESRKQRMKNANKERAMQMGCHDKSRERAIFELSTKKKLAACRRFKREGAAYFEEGQFFRSAAAYRRVLIYLNYTFPDDLKEKQEYEKLQESSELNISACKLKTGEYQEAIQLCDRVLQSNPKSVKALLRRARAFRLSDEYGKSMGDLNRAIEIAPTNKALRREMDALKDQMKVYKEESRRLSAAMFRRRAPREENKDADATLAEKSADEMESKWPRSSEDHAPQGGLQETGSKLPRPLGLTPRRPPLKEMTRRKRGAFWPSPFALFSLLSLVALAIAIGGLLGVRQGS